MNPSLVEHDLLHVLELGAVVGVVAEAHQLRGGGRVLLFHLGRHKEGRYGGQLQHARVDGLREEEAIEQGHRQAERLQVEAELAVDGADPPEDSVPHLWVEERLRGQAVEHVIARLQRLAWTFVLSHYHLISFSRDAYQLMCIEIPKQAP